MAGKQRPGPECRSPGAEASGIAGGADEFSKRDTWAGRGLLLQQRSVWTLCEDRLSNSQWSSTTLLELSDHQTLSTGSTLPLGGRGASLARYGVVLSLVVQVHQLGRSIEIRHPRGLLDTVVKCQVGAEDRVG